MTSADRRSSWCRDVLGGRSLSLRAVLSACACDLAKAARRVRSAVSRVARGSLCVISICILTSSAESQDASALQCSDMDDDSFFRATDVVSNVQMYMENETLECIEHRDEKSGETPLHKAARYAKDSDVIGDLVEYGLEIDARDDNKQTPLHKAAEYSDTPEVIDALLKHEADPNALDESSETPLHRAARRNENLGVIQRLLSHGSDPTVLDEDEEVPLHKAARSNENPEVVRILAASMKEGTLDVRDRYGRTPLHLAAQDSEDVRVIDELLEAESNPNVPDSNGQTPLHVAAQSGKDEEIVTGIMGHLLRQGADLEARDEENNTPLHVAALRGRLEIVEYLLDNDAEPNSLGNHQGTPLHFAAMRSKDSGVIDLLASESAMDAVDENGETPLHWAARWNPNVEVIHKLLRLGFGLEQSNGLGDRPLHVAARSNELDVIDILLDAHADPYATGRYGAVPLHSAAAGNSNPKVIEKLVERMRMGRDESESSVVDQRDGYGETPLHWGARQGDVNVIVSLLQMGANPDAKNRAGDAPLHVAVRWKNSRAVVDSLLKADADPNLKNGEGKGPFCLMDELDESDEFEDLRRENCPSAD